MRISHLNGLRALEATLRNGTFRAAADDLGVTVAAVGQQIRTLEDYLECKLFDRLPSGAVPTKAAKEVGAQLTRGFSEIEQALETLRGRRELREFTVTMSENFLQDWLSERLPRFFQFVPGVDIQFHTGNEFVDLLRAR